MEKTFFRDLWQTDLSMHVTSAQECKKKIKLESSVFCFQISDSGVKYDLAVKMMFNYGIASNSEAIMREMHREAVPSKLAETHEQMNMWQNG